MMNNKKDMIVFMIIIFYYCCQHPSMDANQQPTTHDPFRRRLTVKYNK